MPEWLRNVSVLRPVLSYWPVTSDQEKRLLAARGNVSVMVRNRDRADLLVLLQAGLIEFDGPVYHLTEAGRQWTPFRAMSDVSRLEGMAAEGLAERKLSGSASLPSVAPIDEIK